jgi:hypothetical protein
VRVRRLALRQGLPLAGGVTWAVIAVPLAIFLAGTTNRDWVLVAILAAPVAIGFHRHQVILTAAILVGSMVLRLAFLGSTSSDPIVVSQLAAQAAFSGGNPYAERYLADQIPYPYGPLGLLAYQGGIPVEIAATVATSVILAANGAWITMALFNAWPQFVYMPVIGNNDFSVGLVSLAGLVLLVSRPRLGVALLAAAVAIKPYAVAWALPAAVFAGPSAALVGAAISLVFWSPVLLVWGVPSFVKAVTDAEAVRASLGQVPSWSFGDIPWLRWLALPASLLALRVRTLRGALLVGTIVFVLFLGFAPRAPQPYLGFLLPIVGLAIEGQVAHRQRRPEHVPSGSQSAGRQ